MKQRFSSLDVKVVAHELNATLSTLRISNIYDLSSRIFLLKCAKPGSKAQLLVDSGFRCHLTSFSRTANPTPSAFVSRLRKCLKSRRITKVAQIGTDRVIDIQFSDGQYRLFLEFFAAGNIILTDSELNVLALLRQVSEGDEDVDVKLGSKYVLDAKQNFQGVQPVTKDRTRNALEKHIERMKIAQEAGGKKAKRQKGADDLKKALSIGFSEYPPHLIEHVFVQSNFDSAVKPDAVLQSEALQDQLVTVLEEAYKLFKSFETTDANKGYIIAKEKDAAVSNDHSTQAQSSSERDRLVYDDFHPFRPSQFDNQGGIKILEFEGFNKTVDEFYSSVESQKLESRLTEKEEAARKKLAAAKSEHEKRLGALQQVQEMHIRKAQAIEANTHRVEEAVAAVNGLVGQGMDWVDIGKLIENEQKRDNPVAGIIKLPLKLHENTVTLLLDEPGAEVESDSDLDQTDSEADSDDDTSVKPRSKPTAIADIRLAIDVDLALTPWANAREYYDQKKSAAVKEQKTVQASTKALQSITKKTEADLKKGLKQEKAALRPARKQFWFERFLYFISSDGYLVLGGKDAQQNELLYRRYLKKGDLYVHADLQGASSVIVKNNPADPDAPIPPSTLSQAGALTVCTSSAWDSKAVMAAWWVNADQVSKTAPTGEYIKTGGFMIKGKKNFLPPAQLILGFGIMWLISEESRVNHGKHRLQRTESMLSGEAEILAADAQGLTLDEASFDEADDDPQDGAGAAIPDLEDSGQAAQEEIAEDIEAIDVTDEDGGEQDDKESIANSDADEHRANPLQNSGAILNEGIDAQQASTNGSETASDDDEDEQAQQDDVESSNAGQESTTQLKEHTQQQQQSQKQPRRKRGQNTKAKRAAREKYALQSDEERELAMSLLGSTKGEQKREAEEIARQAREEKSQADKERRRAQHERAAEAERKRTERLAKMEKAGIVGDPTEDLNDEDIDSTQLELERKELLNIDLLVPYPEPHDELIAAIPVVAPWTAMARHKYKVKLQPGSTKKGKALKEIVGNWNSLGTRGPKVVDENNLDKEKVWARELECIKAWRVEEIVGVLPVKGVRIVASGGGGVGGSASTGGGGGGGGKGKTGAGRGGRGSKKR